MKKLKGFYQLMQYTLIFILVGFSQKVSSQCLATYTTANYFCDLDSLYLTVVPLEGVGPFSFIWETGETTQTIIIPLALGDYMFTVTDANGCVFVDNAHIKPFPDVLFYPYNQNACEGDTVTLFLEWFRDSIPGATYLWSTGATTPTITLTDDLVWSVTVTDPSTGCEFVIPPGLFDFHPTPPPQIVGPNIICNGETVILSVTGGPFGALVWYTEGVWEGTWSETFEVTAPGTYYVWGSSPEAGYCWGKDTIVITAGTSNPPLLDGPPDLCTGQSGLVSVINSSQFISFIWNNGQTGSSFTATNPGTYTVTVTSSGGCTGTESITIDQNTGPALTTDATAATCGESNGSIELTPTPPQTYTFNWSNGATTQDLVNIPPGSYSVTVTDTEGCTATTTQSVPDEPISITLNATLTPNNSCSNFNGAIDLFVTPLTETYSFLWSNGATSEDLFNLVPGSYAVTVSTGVNCSTSAIYVVDDLSGAAEILPVIVPTSCGESNGSITIQLDGGTGPFTYLWSNGNTTEGLSDIPAGTYSITVTGADGCVSTSVIQLPNEDPNINISGIIIPNSSCDQSNGEIDITVAPEGSYEFSWSNGSTSEDLINLGAGTYTVTVILGATCIETSSFTVTNENIPFTIAGSTTPNTSCSNPNGAIDLFLTPSGSYTFLWSSGETSEDLQNLDGGTYSVTVTNNEGCAINESFTIDNISTSIDISGFSVANTSCLVPNGIIDISVTPPGTYTFLWSTGATTEDLQGIGAGTYQVIVTGSDGCTVDTSFDVINQNSSFSLSAVPVDNNSCTNPSGGIDLTITPAGTYSYIWSNGMTTEDLTSLNGGSYSVTVTDNNSCSSSAMFTVGDNTTIPDVSALIIDEVCNSANGSIDLTVSQGGNGFLWSTGATSEDLTGISAGTYSVTVTSGNGCIVTDTFTVTNTSNNFSISAITTDNSSCVSPNGSLDLMIAPAGSYTLIWSTGSTLEDLQNLNAGTYTVTVTDQLNCSSSATFIIGSNVVDPVINESITPASCGQANGSIQLDVIPTAGNVFTWSNGSTTEDLLNLAAGLFSVTVTATNGCTATSTFTVPDNNSNFTIEGTTTENNSCITANGTIDLTLTPTGVYTYAWSNGASTPDLQNLEAGTYEVTVTDAFNCTSIQSFTISENIVFPEISNSVVPATCGQNNGSVDITVSITAGNTFLWTNGNTQEDLTNVAPGNYQVTVTADNGCSATLNIEVPNQNSNFAISSSVTDNSSCNMPAGSIDLTVTPAGTYFFNWSNGVTTEDLINIPSGIYEVTVTDQFNCSSSEMIIVEDTSNPPILADVITSATCGNQNGRIDLTLTPATGYTFLWSTGAITEDLENIAEGAYSVTATDVNGCSATGNYIVPLTEPVLVTIDADLTSVGMGETVTCSLQINVPLTSLSSISWFPDENLTCNDMLCLEQTFTITDQMEVSVMAIDTNGCMGIASLMLDIERDYQVYIPNVFTPNGDGPNDRFTIYGNEEIEHVVLLQIFDRWGDLVFEKGEFPVNEPNYGWDGVFREKMMNPAVFAYRAIVLFTNGEEHFYKGDVTLVR